MSVVVYAALYKRRKQLAARKCTDVSVARRPCSHLSQVSVQRSELSVHYDLSVFACVRCNAHIRFEPIRLLVARRTAIRSQSLRSHRAFHVRFSAGLSHARLFQELVSVAYLGLLGVAHRDNIVV